MGEECHFSFSSPIKVYIYDKEAKVPEAKAEALAASVLATSASAVSASSASDMKAAADKAEAEKAEATKLEAGRKLEALNAEAAKQVVKVRVKETGASEQHMCEVLWWGHIALLLLPH
jgi:uncharacterized protein YegJ (DUF2314 family)